VLDTMLLTSQDLHHDAEFPGATATSTQERNPSAVPGGWGVFVNGVKGTRHAGGHCLLRNRDFLCACRAADFPEDGPGTLFPASEASEALCSAAEGLASGRRVVSESVPALSALASGGLGTSDTGALSQVGSRRLSPFHPVCVRITGRGAWWRSGAGHWVA
jgi:hypothetical protein